MLFSSVVNFIKSLYYWARSIIFVSEFRHYSIMCVSFFKYLFTLTTYVFVGKSKYDTKSAIVKFEVFCFMVPSNLE